VNGVCELCGSELPPREPGPGRPAVYCRSACRDLASAWATFYSRALALAHQDPGPSGAAWLTGRVGDVMALRNDARTVAREARPVPSPVKAPKRRS
jgi:hypothetical protein